MPCTPIDIEVEVVTPDQMRKITFGIVKTCNNDGTESWKINFELDEKQQSTDADFALMAKVTINVGEADQPAAQNIANNKTLSDAQAAQAIVAGDTLKKQTAGQATAQDVNDDVTQVLHADGN